MTKNKVLIVGCIHSGTSCIAEEIFKWFPPDNPEDFLPRMLDHPTGLYKGYEVYEFKDVDEISQDFFIDVLQNKIKAMLPDVSQIKHPIIKDPRSSLYMPSWCKDFNIKLLVVMRDRKHLTNSLIVRLGHDRKQAETTINFYYEKIFKYIKEFNLDYKLLKYDDVIKYGIDGEVIKWIREHLKY